MSLLAGRLGRARLVRSGTSGADGTGGGEDGDGGGLLRAAAPVTAGNLLSRVTGVGRTVAVTAALGTTFLGNTYQSANLVSNVLFELLAAGVLSAVLVPSFVRLIDEDRRRDAADLAGAILGLALAVLGAITLLGLLGRTQIMEFLTAAVEDDDVRAAEIELGRFLLLLFLPQLVLYAVSAVVTGLLQGDRRLTAAAFAPAANNVIVVATMAVFWVMHNSGDDPATPAAALDLPTSERLVLAVGTTAGVAVMALLPVMAAWRAGLRLRPRWDLKSAELRRLGRAGAWGAAYLALGQVVIVLTLVLANRVEGGVVAYQLAFAAFLLPHALLSHPVTTALYPRLASAAHQGRFADAAAALGRGLRLLVFVVAPAAALLMALAKPGLRLIQFGALDPAGAELAARVTTAYGVGLLGYCTLFLLARTSYAFDDMRSPTVVNAMVAAVGCGLMTVLWVTASDGGDRVAALGLSHSAAFIAGAVAMAVVVRRRLGQRLGVTASLARASAAAALAGIAAYLIAEALPSSGRGAAVVAVAAAGTAGVVVYLAVQWAVGSPEVRGYLHRPRPAAAS